MKCQKMLFNLTRGNTRRKFFLLTLTVVFVYVMYLVMTLNRQPGKRSDVITQLPQQPHLLLKHLQRRQHDTHKRTGHTEAATVPDSAMDAEISVDSKDDNVGIRSKYDPDAKGPVREDNARYFETVSKYDNRLPDIKVAAIDGNAKDVEIHSKYDEIKVSTNKKKVEGGEIKSKYDDTNAKVVASKDNSRVYVGSNTGPYGGPQNAEQKAVVEMFKFAWSNYREHAWGKDELRPVSGRGTDWFGVGLTIVDSLDTLYIMGLKDEFAEARDWVANHLAFNSTMDVSLFEIVIRELGGLLSAYFLSSDHVFLEKAELLAKKLRPCMDKTAIPCSSIYLNTAEANFGRTNLASVGSVQLEFRALARATNNHTWEATVDALNAVLHKLNRVDGLLTTAVKLEPPYTYRDATVSVGAEGDSFYEYLLKQWLQTGKTKPQLKDDFIMAMEGIKKHLVQHSKNSDLTFVGKYFSMDMVNFVAEMEHLTCYLPGVLTLAHMNGLGAEYQALGEKIAATCHMMYQRSPTGLSPEVVSINIAAGPHRTMDIATETAYSLLRPEAVESFFYLYRATRDKKYKEWGWQIYEAIEKHAKVKHGYSSIENVQDAANTAYLDKMETFFLAETLKYLYLLFSDDPNLLPLDKYVFNTEAHPLPIYTR